MNAPRITLPLDHLGVAGRDVQSLIRLYSKLGFRITPKQELMATTENGVAVPLGQQSAHIMFGNSYLELTGVPGNLQEHHLGAYLERFSGLHILALASNDARASHQQLQGQGVELGAPQLAQREVLYGSGGTARFRWFQAMTSQLPSALVCLVEHLTPEIVFQDKMAAHPNGVLGISRIGYFYDKPDELLRQLAPLESAEGIAIDIIDELAFPGDKPLSERYMAEIEFTVESISAAADLLERSGVDFGVEEGVLAVSNQSAGGVGLLFQETPVSS